MTDVSDDIVSNPTRGRTFEDILTARLSRRAALGGTLAGAAALFFNANAAASARVSRAAAALPRTSGLAAAADTGALLGFTPIDLGFGDTVVIPDGYVAQVIIPWGDPIVPGGPAFEPDASNSAAEQAVQLGQGHDGMWFFPLGAGPAGNQHGLLAINHEFTDDTLLFPDGTANWDAEKTLKSQHAHGVAIVEIMLGPDGWEVVDGPNARRIHVNTPMTFSGAATGHALVQTAADPAGTTPVGTANNCANGYTPWGTYLTCEENFNGYFAATGDFTADELQARYGLTAEGFGYLWHTTDPRFDLSDPASANEPNRFGWVVEIDPADPASTPVKRTALGRVKHEGATVAKGHGGRVVVYLGDDERFEYIYKFVSAGNWKALRARGRSPLDEGTLYVAKFNDDGTGEWLPLVHGTGPLTAANGFADQGDVLVKTRLAGDAVGATKMDRPEWISVTPNGDVYVTLTNNTRRTAEQVDAPNPRGPNPWGHILRWHDSKKHTGTTFEWDIFLLAGPGGGVDGSTIDAEDAFGSPDGLYCDPDGRLFIETDGSQPDGANNQLLVADTGTGELRRFLTGPLGCEITGVTTTPDHRTLFINVQHPGEGVTSTWPSGVPGDRPRPATVAITKLDGGIIGT